SRVLARGGSLHLVCDRPLTLRMLTVTGLDRVLGRSSGGLEAEPRHHVPDAHLPARAHISSPSGA
ncbi:hypothetical protein ABZ483_32205, partial [Streptomyces sp. NPDC005732]